MKDDFWLEDSRENLFLPLKRKRQVRQKKLQFVGWGSKPLFEFLESLGKDTSKELNRYDVTAIINEYVNANKLADPEKKKRVICDEWLFSLFGKKSVSRIKVYDLLESHFAENRDSSEDDFQCSLEEQDCGTSSVQKKPSNLGLRLSYEKKKVSEQRKSCFAAICPENINLVYLRRTLVQDLLLKAPESFEHKVISSLVRIKSDPHDYLQKNSHQLQQVIGVRMINQAGNDGKEFHLQLSNCINDVPIGMLSDENFSEAECDDLHERVKAGLLKRPTVVEFEEKARMLHQDIMKHWIPRELAHLQKLIDLANEKGWRRELFEYLERRKLLENPSEKERLLAEFPEVIADDLKPEARPPDTLETAEANGASPSSCNWEACDNYYSDDADGENSNPIQNGRVVMATNGDETGKEMQAVYSENDDCWKGDESSKEMQAVNSGSNGGCQGKPGAEAKPTPVIELSDDEIEAGDVKTAMHCAVENPDDCVWQYLDPQGVVQGPFPLTSLRRWHDFHYFDPGFMVWKNGESRDHAVLLTDVLRLSFPCKLKS